MILKGSQRGGAKQLALHLLNAQDNDHIELHAMDGFVADDVEGALREVYALSRATQCKQFMFSLSLSPPIGETVTVEDYELAVQQAAERLGLSGQPYLMLFHEKHGRRHCHAVFSRIDTQNMKAINLPFYKDRLNELAHELFLAHNWDVPDGFRGKDHTNPLNYDLTSYHEAKKAKRDPQAIKSLLLECWHASDDRKSFEAALSERGFFLCKGDRRDFLAVDMGGKPYSLSRWLDEKPKTLRSVLGDPEHLPDFDEVETRLQGASDVSHNSEASLQCDTATVADSALAERLKLEQAYTEKLTALNRERQRIVERQRTEREALNEAQHRRRIDQALERQRNLRKGLSGLWDRLTGKYGRQLTAIHSELETAKTADNLERLKLCSQHLAESGQVQARIDRLQKRHEIERQAIHVKIADSLSIAPDREIAEGLVAKRIRDEPDHVLSILTDKESVFTKADIAKVLNAHIHDRDDYRNLQEQVLASDQLVELRPDSKKGNDGKNQQSKSAKSSPLYSTREMIDLERGLMDNSHRMVRNHSHGLATNLVSDAIKSQNAKLQAEIGVTLSAEQQEAIRHITGDKQLTCVVGVAGAGKSTLVSTAREVWEKAGYRVLGAALAGKAAKGLEQSSGIPSRTLASFEFSWASGSGLLQKGDVLVIDEAGMIGSKQMARFVAEAKDKGAKLVLIGDPEQLQPINAGAPFRAIVEGISAARLGSVHRQKEDWQRKASEDFAHGETGEALAAYDDHGAILMMDTADEAMSALVYDYMEDRTINGEGKTRLALAHRRDDVKEINETIRAMRKAVGELDGEKGFMTANETKQFAVGDRMLFTRNDRNLGVKNGMLGTVSAIAGRQLTVELDDKADQNERSAKITFSTRDYNHIDHGYATTIHKSQGATVDQTYVLASHSMDRHLTYVAMTRHRDETKLYAGCDEFRTDAKLYSALNRQREKQSSLAFVENTNIGGMDTLAPEPELGFG